MDLGKIDVQLCDHRRAFADGSLPQARLATEKTW